MKEIEVVFDKVGDNGVSVGRYNGKFYKYTCSLVFENAKPYLKDATIIIDGSGSRQFKKEFKTYLRKKVGTSIIKKVKIQSSRANNLIQLADMVAGAIHRSFTNKGDKDVYRKMISSKEILGKFGQNKTTASIPRRNARIGLRQFEAVAIPSLFYQ